jgi:eukaryotic-like serine/threonine-protein kinase
MDETKPEQTMIANGKYELLDRAGSGGMATVFRALLRGAAGFARFVAVKQIQTSLLSNREFIAMFMEEARVGSQLQHPNIVQTYDFERDEHGVYFLVLEWVEGLDLGRYLEAHRRAGLRCAWPLVVAFGVEALRGLSSAHERLDAEGKRAPVIHRDVTPQNILLGTNGVVKLGDFGLSRAADRVRMTHPDVIKGKLRYLAPEQTQGAEATVQSDLFALGIVIWEAFTLRPLYDAATDVEVFQAARRAEIPSVLEDRPDVPPEVAKLLARALAKEPADRFATAEEMLRGLVAELRLVPQSTDAFILSKAVLRARLTLGMPSARSVPAP